MNDYEDLTKQLSELILQEKEDLQIAERHRKLKKILFLLARGSALALIITAPQTAKLFKGFLKDKSNWNDWKIFNENYLRRTIRSLEKQNIIEIKQENGLEVVKLTDNGRKKVLKYSLSEIGVVKPEYWDKKWRLIFYDVKKNKNVIRDHFRDYLISMGFYPLQESVYLHAYPCEKEVEFLRSYLGIRGEVRMVIAEQIENDQLFREYFSV